MFAIYNPSATYASWLKMKVTSFLHSRSSHSSNTSEQIHDWKEVTYALRCSLSSYKLQAAGVIWKKEEINADWEIKTDAGCFQEEK